MPLNSQYGVPATMQAIHNIIDGVTPAYGLATDEDVKALFAPPADLDDADWATIALLLQNGTISDYYNVGDEKTITLSTGEQATLVIMGFNHDDLSDGSGKAGVTFGMKNLLTTTYRMSQSSSNLGGWNNSVMRTTTMPTIFNQLPIDLQAMIKSVNKKSTSGAQSTTITTSKDKLFLFARVEIDGTTIAGYVSEGEQYEYWQTVKDGTVAADRIKYISNGSGSAGGWWLRSPYVSNGSYFMFINQSGNVSSSLASNTGRVCFGFCI